MTDSTWIGRAMGRMKVQRRLQRLIARDWLLVDLEGVAGRQRLRKLLPLLAFSLVVALGVSALRIDLIRIRYAMASIVSSEQALLEEQRSLILRRRQLRDPIELAALARARGFRPPTRVVELYEPMTASPDIDRTAINRVVVELPAVSARGPYEASRGDWR